MEEQEKIFLRVPGNKESALVIRTTLGGAAILADLDVGTLDDLRMAADECCDCLLHQGVPVEAIEVSIALDDGGLQVCFAAQMNGEGQGSREDAAIMQAVLETLSPNVRLSMTTGGCIRAITLRMPSAKA